MVVFGCVWVGGKDRDRVVSAGNVQERGSLIEVEGVHDDGRYE
jgi:hypothetical protein